MNNLRSHIMRIHKIERALADDQIENLNKAPAHGDNGYVKNSRNSECNDESNADDGSESLNVSLKTGDGSTESSNSTPLPEVQKSSMTETETFYIRTDYFTNSPDVNTKGSKKVTYVCKLCSKEMNHRSNMVDHVRTHTGKKMCKCTICDKPLSRKQNLIHHLKYVHYIDPDRISEFVSKGLIEDSTENSTSADHSSTDYLTTDSTSKSTAVPKTEENTDVDMKKMELEKQKPEDTVKESSCPIDKDCSKLTSTPIEKHVTTGSTNSGLLENTSDTLNGEELQYEVINPDNLEERFFRCKICGFECDRRHYMTAKHILKHTGEKPFICVVCSKPYTRKYVLRNHIRKEHKIVGPEADRLIDASDVSGSKLKNKAAVNLANFQALNEPEKKTVKRKLADTDFSDTNMSDLSFMDENSNMNEENGIGDSVSTACSDSNSLSNSPEKDAGEAGDNTVFSFQRLQGKDGKGFVYRCNLCGFSCTRRHYMASMHKLKHTGAKPYLCVICCKLYSRKYVLRKHLLKEHHIKGKELDDIMLQTGSRVDDMVSDLSVNEPSFDTDVVMDCDVSFQSSKVAKTSDDVTDKEDDTEHESHVLTGHSETSSANLNDSIDYQNEFANVLTSVGLDCIRNSLKKFSDNGIDTTEFLNGETAAESVSESNTLEEMESNNCVKKENMNHNKMDCLLGKKKGSMNSDEMKKMPDVEQDSLNGDEMENTLDVKEESTNGDERIIMLDENQESTAVDDLESQSGAERNIEDINNVHNILPLNISDASTMQSISDLGEGAGGFLGNRKGSNPIKVLINSLIDETSLTCLECGKTCTKMSNLRQHIRIKHLNLQQFVCSECNKSFNTNFNLKVHMRQHLDAEQKEQNRYGCDVCKRTFTTKSYLKLHKEKYHSTNESVEGISN